MKKLQEVIAHTILNYPKKKNSHLNFRMRLPTLFYLVDCKSIEKTGEMLTSCKWVKSVMPFCDSIQRAIKHGMTNPDPHNEKSPWRSLFLETYEKTNYRITSCTFPIYSVNASHSFCRNEGTLTSQEKIAIAEATALCANSSSEEWIDVVFKTPPMTNAMQNQPMDLIKAYKTNYHKGDKSE